ncbi:hypothetical protein [Nocardia fusca]|uniref:Alpha/beta hydrolase family protein n=1 Tax=Nocardia fusca TaxID=941183 RepID=A0ABV3FIM5_9NOCA
MTIDFFWLGGTGYGHQIEGISKAFRDALDDRFTFHYLEYPAAYGSPAYGESNTIGRRIVLDAVGDTPNRACIGGFSQGAAAVGDAAMEIGAGLHPGLELDAVALIADPLRPVGGTMPGLAPADGYGIAGNRPILGRDFKTFWAANPADVITSAGAGSPLRSLADFTEMFSLGSPEEAEAWMKALIARAKERRWQRWWSIENVLTWGGAINDAAGYLSGRHTVDYVAQGYCRKLATAVNRGVR